MSVTRPTRPIRIAPGGIAPVVFSTEDFDTFVLTQSRAVEAVKAHVAREDGRREIGEKVVAWVYRLREWCKEHAVASCVVSPRMDDLLVVVTSRDEDDGGKLHDSMAELDLESFNRNKLRVSWLLLRASEADGLSAFADLEQARTVYRADA